MKHLEKIQLDLVQCRKDLAEFQHLLASRPALKESQDILPFFRDRLHLSAFLGSTNAELLTYDRAAHEYDLFGDFVCDLVVGDSVSKTYGFIEFEDTAPNSIFVRQGARATPDWSPRFEHGYSQITDWFCMLDDMEKTDAFEARFGSRTIHFFGLLVIGRTEALAVREQRRLAWRQERTVINSRHIRCLTFDQLAEDLAARLRTYQLGAHAAGS